MTAGPADLEFLGYDRFQIVWQPDPEDPNTAADEEAHCYKMRQLGATWWESESAEFYASREVGSSTEEEKFIITGWPAGGGVWVLNGTVAEAGRKQAGMAFNAFNMEERSKIIEKLGGAFYANPKDCPDLDLAEPEDPVVQSRDEEL
ncbi:hypothetical protein VTJ04DRAFT_4231 [Mycothermus thermophilus]|uniref:uncharacterized protein n=1 Tax=Humicola insolens TaxID=85995 RepID=UPI00374429BC